MEKSTAENKGTYRHVQVAVEAVEEEGEEEVRQEEEDEEHLDH